jgi:hypothetical protein
MDKIEHKCTCTNINHMPKNNLPYNSDRVVIYIRFRDRHLYNHVYQQIELSQYQINFINQWLTQKPKTKIKAVYGVQVFGHNAFAIIYDNDPPTETDPRTQG